eukprot:488970_1
MSADSVQFGTKSIHSHQKPNPLHGAITPGIEMSTIFAQPSPGRKFSDFSYSRANNPTRSTMEKLIASIECGKHGISFSSGSAAIVAILSVFAANKNIICGQDVWGGTNRINKTANKINNVTTTYIDLRGEYGVNNLQNLLSNNPTKYSLIWLETPTNPALKISDIKALCTIARKYNIISVIDNTFATPYNTLPLKLGCDIVMHSVTKYLNGHSDVCMGIAITNNDNYNDKLRDIQECYGAIPDAFPCYLVIRSVKTLSVRMKRHAFNAMKVAQFLESHPKVQTVYYPFLKSNIDYKLAKKQMKTGSGMVSFLLKGGLKESKQFLENLKVWTLTASLGCPESLACHPAIMTHHVLTSKERKEQGILDNFIRLSVGLEDYTDLINGLKSGLKAVTYSKL